MDLLFKRYASPFSLLSGVICSGRFAEFVSELLEIVNEENEDKTMWDFFLHRVWDKSYLDFKNGLTAQQKMDKPVNFEATIKESYNILSGFVPE